MTIYDPNIVEPFFPDIHTGENGYSTTTDDILECVQACPVHTGRDENEIGEDCEGCMHHDPDRANLCLHIQMCRRAMWGLQCRTRSWKRAMA